MTFNNEPYKNIKGSPIVSWIDGSYFENRLDAEYYRPEYILSEKKLIQSGFQTKDLDSLTEKIHDGPGGWSLNISEYKETGIPLIRIVDFRNNLDVSKMVYISEEKHKELERYEVIPGDVLITAAGSIGESLVVPKRIKKASFRDLIRARVTDQISSYYLVSFLNSKYGRTITRRLAHGAVQLHLKLYDARTLQIPIPELKVQEFIGAKMRLAEKCREEARMMFTLGEQDLNRYLNLPQLNMNENPVGWQVDPISDLLFGRLTAQNYLPVYTQATSSLRERGDCLSLGCLIKNKGRDISGGATPKGAEYPIKGVPFLRVQNVLRNFIDLNDIVFIDEKTNASMKRSQVKPYDVILTITGYPGNAACVTPDLLPLNMNQHSVRFSLIDKVDPFYIAAFINSEYGIAQVNQRAAGATRDALDYPSVKSILIPIIDLDSQKKIGTYFRQSAYLRRKAQDLIEQAKIEVENLVDGSLNTRDILAGNVKPPSWEEIEFNKV